MSGKAFFFQRLNDHIQYLKKIQATLEGKGDFQGTSYHDCKLGNWVYGDGPEEASSVSDEARKIFDTLIEPHQQFHEASKAALEKQQSGDSASSDEEVTKMHKLSNTLVNILLELDKLSK
jgi:hypothetical protein